MWNVLCGLPLPSQETGIENVQSFCFEKYRAIVRVSQQVLTGDSATLILASTQRISHRGVHQPYRIGALSDATPHL